MVSEVEEEEAVVEVCFNFLLFPGPVISHAFHLANQAEGIVEDAVVAEGEYEVFSFLYQLSVSCLTRSTTRWWYPRTRWSPERSRRPGQG